MVLALHSAKVFVDFIMLELEDSIDVDELLLIELIELSDSTYIELSSAILLMLSILTLFNLLVLKV